MSTRPSEEAAADPDLEAEIERALAPYRDLLPPERLADFRAELEDALRTHHVGKRLLDATRPPPVVTRSGDRPVEGALDDASAEAGAAKAVNDKR